MGARTAKRRIPGLRVIAGLLAVFDLGACPHTVLGATAVEPADVPGTTDAGGSPPEVAVRLLGLRVFWVDPPGSGATGSDGPPGAAPPGESHGAFAIQGERGLAVRVARVSPGQGDAGDAGAVIGTRTTSRFGTFNALNIARLVALSAPARDTARDLIDLRAMERRVYWEAAFALTGIRRDEITSVEAVGPALIRPPRAWAGLLRGALEAPSTGEVAGRSCLGMGPLSLCLNLPGMIRSFAGDRRPRERSRVDVTRSLWDGGTSCGAMVTGRLLDYSTVTFRLRMRGRGAGRAAVAYLPPYDLRSALDRSTESEGASREPAGAPMDPPMVRPNDLPREGTASAGSLRQVRVAAPAAFAAPAARSGRGIAASCATAAPGVRRGAGPGAFRARGVPASRLVTGCSVCPDEETDRRIPLSAAGVDR